MKTAIELADAIDNSEETTGFERRCASMLRTLSQENEALKADAERYRWLSRNPTYLGWDADFEAEFVDFEVDKAIDAMKGKS